MINNFLPIIKLTKWLQLFLMVMVISTISPVQAGVVVNYSTGTNLAFIGPYSVGRDKSVNSIMATSTNITSALGFVGICQIKQSFSIASPETSIGSGIYTTDVSGIGIRFYVVNGGSRTQITGSGGLSLTTTLTNPGSLPSIEAELVVIGPVSAGRLTNLPLINEALSIAGSGNDATCSDLSPSTQMLQVTVSDNAIVALTCTIPNANLSVQLPIVSTTSLNGSGKTAGLTRFTIPLECQNDGANVYVTITDGTNTSNETTLLNLTSTSTASNVKLQLTKADSSLVNYGPDSALAGSINQWLVGPTGTTNGIPLVVKYYSTGVAGPGTVEAVATFTMSYQ